MSEEVPKPQAVVLPVVKPSKTPTQEIRIVKNRGNLKLVLGIVTTLTGGSGVGYLTNRGNGKETTTQVEVVKQQLTDHINTSNERNEELKKEQHRISRRTKRLETNQLINKAQNDLVLDKLGVPKSKRPTAEDVTPVEDDGE